MKLLKIVLAISLLGSTQVSQAEVKALDRVSIVVNDGVILKSEIDALVNRVKQRSIASNQELPNDRVLKTQATERLIDNLLKKQMAERMSMRIGDTQLDQTISNIAAEQKLSLDEFKAQLAKEGLDFATYRESVRDDILLGQVERIAVRRRINISEQEVVNLAEQIKHHGQSNTKYRLGHILISHNGDESTDGLKAARERADRVIELLNDNGDFKRIAITSSSGPKALEGGDWGFMNINEMPTLFTDAVKGKGKGDVIGPFKSGNGYHILKILDLQGQQQMDVNEVNAKHILIKPSIILSDQRAKEMLEGFIEDIKAGKATIEELAKEHSDDPGSAIKGGELGWADPSVYVPAFKNTLAQLEQDEISAPFKSSHGWHIVKLLGKRKVDATEQFIKNRAHQLLFNRKFSEESDAWAREMRSSAYIEILD
ncbi:peptidylprolyl isomerase SurA [Psychrobium sp. MM17-31]|uniref:peptidylprolyl isomerase SurA n=1 Tax=Psychrobium sp. MM17-31 TaxID=2917758 RepID=UPI001EF66711|nr:peptidylprolyl isomerase SurA [Psychrobium sp. MM17-31]MCG7531430.1 peptidylprolyl isomerase SurA [Psychrobium sp. MM17-31]